MKLCRALQSLGLAFFVFGFTLPAHAQIEPSPQNPDNSGKPAAKLKLLKSPTAPFPEEALKKNIEGKVELSLVVDAEGHVSAAKVLAGPPELYQAALDSVKQWQFEPPSQAPAETKAIVAYGHPKPCPGPVSDMGSMSSANGLTNAKGISVNIINDSDWLPPYFVQDRKAGVAGEMELSVTINAKGKVTKIQVTKSLSPHLDKGAMKTVRKLRFKLRDGSPGTLPDTFPLHINFQPECNMHL
jgi:TonB family protein